jgi:hypothetical protein
MTAVVPLAICGYLIIVACGIFGHASRARSGVRALDHFVNASVFNGTAWESISSHAWRKRTTWWGKIIIDLTNSFQPGHCQRANRRERAIVKIVTKRKLFKQTIH